MTDTAPKPYPSIDALEGSHTFPGRYTIKVIGANSPRFEMEAKRIAGEVSGLPEALNVSHRVSSGGAMCSVTLDIYVKTAHQVQALYVELRELPGLRFIM